MVVLGRGRDVCDLGALMLELLYFQAVGHRSWPDTLYGDSCPAFCGLGLRW